MPIGVLNGLIPIAVEIITIDIVVIMNCCGIQAKENSALVILRVLRMTLHFAINFVVVLKLIEFVALI